MSPVRFSQKRLLRVNRQPTVFVESHVMIVNDVAANGMTPIITGRTTWKVDQMIGSTRNTTSSRTDGGWRANQIRIGAVSYLNSKPLVEHLPELCPTADVLFDVPSRLADQLAAGSLDVALIPSIEAFLDPSYEIVSDACVATRGPVLSVKLYSRVHPGEIRRLALDEGSRTSAALTRIMLNDRFGVQPKLEHLLLNQGTEDTTADAILLIGDRAMFPPCEDFHTVWDLGEEWVNWTGLPFVFAMWVTRTGVELADVEPNLAAAREIGLAQIHQLAAEGADQLGLEFSAVESYLTKNLHFRLGPAEKSGLMLFQELAAQNGLTRRDPVNFREAALSDRRVDFAVVNG